jgi:hypothetical protein
MVGIVALLWATTRSEAAVAANGDNLTAYQRTPGGVIENYVTMGDDNLAFGLAAADTAFSAAIADPDSARDKLDAFVPIQLKRWNNNAAKALMLRMAQNYFVAQNPTTNLVPTAIGDLDKVSNQNKANTMNLRHPYYVGKLLEWTDDPTIRAKAQALANATIQYFTPTSGSGFLNNVNVTNGGVQSQTTPILAVNWGLALQGMGAMTQQFASLLYWTWAGPRLQHVWTNRLAAGSNGNSSFADVYNSQGWARPVPSEFNTPAVIEEVEDLSDTDTLYLLRFAYEGARLASDWTAMSLLESAASQWFTSGWLDFDVGGGEIRGHNTRKLFRATGLPATNQIYSDGMWNYIYTLGALYRMTGNAAVVARIEALWETYLAVSPTGLLVGGLRNGDEALLENGNTYAQNQALMLDALIDAYLATGSTTLLADAQALAIAIRGRPAAEQEPARDSTAEPFFRVAEATHGGIGRLEVNFGSIGGRVTVRTTTGVAIAPTKILQNQSIVVYLPQSTYKVELGHVSGPLRAVTLPVTQAGVKIDYLAGSPTTSFVTGVIVQDNNDNAIPDAGDTTPAGARIYVDANNNGSYNTGEINQVVTGTGSYVLPVPPGVRNLRAALPTGTTSRWTAPTTSVVNGVPAYAFTFHTSGLSVTPAAFGWTTKKRISGNVFHDVNGNSVKNSNEPYLTESIVYLDTNNNGLRNFGEPFAPTATGGAYSIGNLTAGGNLRIVRRSAVPNVSTPATGVLPLTLSTSGQHTTGRNFGVR